MTRITLQIFPVRNVRGGCSEVVFNLPEDKVEKLIEKLIAATEPIVDEYEEFILE